MKLSAPIYRLKRQAKLLSRRENVPLHKALDSVAQQEGFTSWSLLATQLRNNKLGQSLLQRLNAGDLLLLGARPGHGKTLLSIELAIEAMTTGHKSFFFSLEYTESDIANSFNGLGSDMTGFGELFAFDGSENICAAYMIEQLAQAPIDSVVIVDYLQLLDQNRNTPPLMEQVQALKTFAQDRGLIFVFISQIQKTFDTEQKTPGETQNRLPELADVRLPNPLNLALFDKSCFLNSGEIEIRAL